MNKKVIIAVVVVVVLILASALFLPIILDATKENVKEEQNQEEVEQDQEQVHQERIHLVKELEMQILVRKKQHKLLLPQKTL